MEVKLDLCLPARYFGFTMVTRRSSILVVVGMVLALSGCAAAQTSPAAPAEVQADLDYAQVRFVVATQAPDGTWRFDVTVEHRDEGWDHYANVWQVVDPDTLDVVAERVLAHPHDNEQPFTRSLSGVEIPEDLTMVLVRARCNEHGFGGATVLVDLGSDGSERSDGSEHYEVHRPPVNH